MYRRDLFESASHFPPMRLTPKRLLEDRPQVLQLVEEVPDIVAGAYLPVRMQVGDFWIVAVVLESARPLSGKDAGRVES